MQSLYDFSYRTGYRLGKWVLDTLWPRNDKDAPAS